MTKKLDLAIRGADVVLGGSAVRADLGIRDGRIASIGSVDEALAELDASGTLILPGVVDVHCHLNAERSFLGGRRPLDNFASGTRAAAAGGITTMCDFVHKLDDMSLVESAEHVARTAGQVAVVDFGLHVVIGSADAAPAQMVADLVAAGFPSFKFYTFASDFVRRGSAYVRILETIAGQGGLAMFHCEDDALLDYFREARHRARKSAVSVYPESKPPSVEASATARALQWSQAAGVRAYIVHLSSRDALSEVRAARGRGADVSVETRPLYLHLTEDAYRQPDARAARFVGTPPLRSTADVEALWQALRDGEIQTVGSDHIGYSLEEKYRPGDDFDAVPKGMANLETWVGLLYSEGVRAGRISLQTFVDVTSAGPARIFGMSPQKGRIAVGADADLCLLDPARHVRLGPSPKQSASDFDVFEGWEATGWPVITISRGEVVWRDDDVVAPPGRGQLVRRLPAARTAQSS